MNNRTIITCLVLIIAACLLLSCASIVGAGFFIWNTSSSTEISQSEEFFAPSEIVPTLEMEVPTPGMDDPKITEAPTNPESEPSSTPSGDSSIPADVLRQMDEIQMQVVLERGLKPVDTVDRKLYSSEQLREKVIQDFEDDYSPEEGHTDAVTLAAFGLLEPDFDLYTFYIDLLSEQIAGFYDQKTKEMVVVQGKSFGGPERLTYAHEYTHALQDQNYDIENGLNYNDDACQADSERCAAIQALIEGDASLSEMTWFMDNATSQDQSEIMDFYNQLDTPIYDSAPEFITLDFTFPYNYGYTFVDYLHNQGGWGTVDRAYQNLPQSTEQILHPERYPDDTPLIVSVPDFAGILGTGWEELDRGTMGEWYTYLILAKGLDENGRLSEDAAARAAEGWGGDAYTVYFNADTQETAMVMQTVWDTGNDADEFAAAFREYARNRFGSSSTDTWQGADDFHTFHFEDKTTTWILAPNAELAAALWAAIP